MQNLKDIFNKKIKELEAFKKLPAFEICQTFNKAVLELFGEKAKGKVEAVSFREGILRVRVPSSIWAQEIQGNWGEFVGEDERIKRIVFEVN